MEEKKRVSFYNYLNNLLNIDTQICSPLYLCLALYIETFVHHNKGILVSENHSGVVLVFQGFIHKGPKDSTRF